MDITDFFDKDALLSMKTGDMLNALDSHGRFIKMPGGWIYESWNGDGNLAVCYVPDRMFTE